MGLYRALPQTLICGGNTAFNFSTICSSWQIILRDTRLQEAWTPLSVRAARINCTFLGSTALDVETAPVLQRASNSTLSIVTVPGFLGPDVSSHAVFSEAKRTFAFPEMKSHWSLSTEPPSSWAILAHCFLRIPDSHSLSMSWPDRNEVCGLWMSWWCDSSNWNLSRTLSNAVGVLSWTCRWAWTQITLREK